VEGEEREREIVRRVTRGPFHAGLQMLTTAIFFEHAIFNLERLALRAQKSTYGSHSGDPRTATGEGERGRHAMALVNTKAAGVVAYPRLFSPPFAHLSSAVLAPVFPPRDLRILVLLFFQ